MSHISVQYLACMLALLLASPLLAQSSPESALQVSRASMQFPPQPLGAQTTAQVITLSTTGPIIDFQSVLFEPADGNFVVPYGCYPLSAAVPCLIMVHFSPQSLGPHNANLVITTGSGAQYKVAVSGTGTNLPATTNTYYIFSELTIPETNSVPFSTERGLSTSELVASPGAALGLDVGSHSVNSEWLVSPAPGGAFEISSPFSGLAFDVEGMSQQQGADVIQWPYWGGPNQQWLFTPAGNGQFSLENVDSGQVLDIPGTYSQSTGYMEQWPNWGGSNQKWQFSAIGSMVPPFSGTYLLCSRFSGLYLQAPFGAGSWPDQFFLTENIDGQWDLNLQPDGSYTIGSVYTGLFLDVPGQSTVPGVHIEQWPLNGGPNQEWQIQPASDGYYSVVSRNSGLVMDVEGMSASPGTPIIQFDNWGGPNQQWKLIPVVRLIL